MATLNVHARNCEVSSELQGHIAEKIDGLERLWPHSDEAVVRISEQRGRFGTEITLLSGGMMTRGEERAGNMRQSFDLAVEKLEGQLRRYKKKVLDKDRRHDNRDDVTGEVIHARLSAAGLAANGVSPSASAATNGHDTHADEEENVVRVKRFALKPMSADEASLQMGLLGHNFFVFRDAESNQVSVVYRRRDGGFGLIEPVSD